MSEKKPNRHQKVPAPVLTQAEIDAREAAKKEAADKFRYWTNRVTKMSTSQFRGELKAQLKLDPANIWAAAYLIVVDNTNLTNPKARLSSYPL